MKQLAGDNKRPTGVLIAWLVLPIVTLLCAAIHKGHVLQLAYTPIALMAAIYLCIKKPADYVKYVLVLWTFSAFARRLADYFSSFQDSSPILLAPLLVCFIGAIRLSQRGLYKPQNIPFALAILAVIYGAIVGVFTVHDKTVIVSMLRWLAPLFFGLFCASNEDRDFTLTKAFLRSLLVCGICSSLYGLIQFPLLPPWDGFWLENVSRSLSVISFGNAAPFEVRVFSTMNSPAVFATMLAAAFVTAFQLKSNLRYLLMGLFFVALILTRVRTEWISVALVLCLLLAHASTKMRLYTAISFVVIVLMLLPALQTDWGELIVKRFDSMNSISNDESYKARRTGTLHAISDLPSRPFGAGLGFLDSPLFARTTYSSVDGVGPHDIGAVEMFFELGFFGVALYFSSLGMVALSVLRRTIFDKGEALTLTAICCNMLLHFVASNPMLGFEGIVFWGAVGILISRVQTANATVPYAQEQIPSVA